MLKAALPAKDVRSAGIGALVGAAAAETAMYLMQERGLDISEHRARQLDEDGMRASDVLLVMERDHQEWIESRWPQARGRVYRWGHWSDFEVPDPYGRDEAAFREAVALIKKGLAEWQDRL